MPDLTLYREDVVVIHDALMNYNNILRKKNSKGELDSSVCEEIKEVARINDVLMDRLIQCLHPAKSKVELDL